jgi:hypothetical protein
MVDENPDPEGVYDYEIALAMIGDSKRDLITIMSFQRRQIANYLKSGYFCDASFLPFRASWNALERHCVKWQKVEQNQTVPHGTDGTVPPPVAGILGLPNWGCGTYRSVPPSVLGVWGKNVAAFQGPPQFDCSRRSATGAALCSTMQHYAAL